MPPTFPDLENRRLVLVDTPGFDNAFLDDTDILHKISGWLARSLVLYLFFEIEWLTLENPGLQLQWSEAQLRCHLHERYL
jgi:hypothetical protein